MKMGSTRRLFLFLSLLLLNLGISQSKSKSQLINLDEENWEMMLEGEWMVEFYAPWCPACKALQPYWEDFSSWSKDLELSVGQVDVTNSPGLSGRFMVTALPTIYHVIDGQFRQYKGPRDRESFITFVEESKWAEIDQIPHWKSPSSVQMTVVSYFFKLSQILRTVHNKLMEDYGLPNWGSYIIFALVTIVLGAILGLLMVCFIDFFYPPKAVVRPLAAEEKDALEEESEDELAEDELVDDQTEEMNLVLRNRKSRKDD